jgi:hypothetical protein
VAKNGYQAVAQLIDPYLPIPGHKISDRFFSKLASSVTDDTITLLRVRFSSPSRQAPTQAFVSGMRSVLFLTLSNFPSLSTRLFALGRGAESGILLSKPRCGSYSHAGLRGPARPFKSIAGPSSSRTIDVPYFSSQHESEVWVILID